MRFFTALVVASALAGLAAFASSEEGKHREHGAHVHGVADMNVAVEGAEVAVELETPAMNILGFEHAPRDEADRQAVEDAEASLKRGEKWLVLSPGAGCHLATADVASSALDHDHEEHAGEEEHKDHEGQEDHQDHGYEEHSEFHVSYVFRCDNPSALNAIQVKWFERFPGMHKIELQAITESRQIGGELTPDQATVELKE